MSDAFDGIADRLRGEFISSERLDYLQELGRAIAKEEAKMAGESVADTIRRHANDLRSAADLAEGSDTNVFLTPLDARELAALLIAIIAVQVDRDEAGA